MNKIYIQIMDKFQQMHIIYYNHIKKKQKIQQKLIQLNKCRNDYKNFLN